jgi:hypothetical protein
VPLISQSVDALKTLFGNGKRGSFATFISGVVDWWQECAGSIVFRDALIDCVARAATSRAHHTDSCRRRGQSLNLGRIALLSVQGAWRRFRLFLGAVVPATECVVNVARSLVIVMAVIAATEFVIVVA